MRLQGFTPAGLCRYLWLALRGRAVTVTGSCLGCGKCCNAISLEGRDGWLRSEHAFREIIARYPEYDRFVVIGRDNHGYLLFRCTWHTAGGGCRDYDRRLPLCRRYPESSLAFSGGMLLPGCGYRFVETASFARILRRELKKTGK